MAVLTSRWVTGFMLGCFSATLCGCNPSNSAGGPRPPDPNVHTGDVDGYRYEIHGDPVVKYEQLGERDMKITSGPNWFEIKDGNLSRIGKTTAPSTAVT